MIISFDTETTGKDFYHGCKPFFVTTCDEEGKVRFWEWMVNPITRQPSIPPRDLEEIKELVFGADKIILQNAKFDVVAMGTVCPELEAEWPWDKTEDTLILGHLLASNMPHDLTSMAIQYLGHDIEPLEKRLNVECEKARRWCRRHLAHWKIAKAGLEETPSAKGKCWKNDTWLPRAIWKHYRWKAMAKRQQDQTYTDDHPWESVLRLYANGDSEVTLPLWVEMTLECQRRGLEEIYRERMKLLPVACAMESHGVTLSRCRLEELHYRYSQEIQAAAEQCISMAAALGHELVLPKGGVNASLREFCFDVLDLPRFTNPKGKTDAPTLNKDAMQQYLQILEADSDALKFIKTLLGKRSRDTACAYMEGYERFWVPINEGPVSFHSRPEEGDGALPLWYRLHPSLNPTGTDTLRWSSSNPNEQNISKKEGFNLRYIFGPAPGREWWSLDAKNIELRLPAYESGQEEFIQLFERPDDPPYFGSNHLLIAHLLFPVEFEKCLKDGVSFKDRYKSTLYQRTKNGNFAVQYGAVDREDGQGTADRTYGIPGAQARIKARFMKQEALNQRCIRFANQHGYIETMPDKTVNPKHGYPLMCTRTDYGRIKPTIPLNYRVQGTAMWWMNKAMVRVHAFFQGLNRGLPFQGKLWPGGYYLVLQVHDELVPDMPSGKGKGKRPWEYNLPIAKEVKRLMELGGDDIGVPTPVSMEYHETTWAEGVAAA